MTSPSVPLPRRAGLRGARRSPARPERALSRWLRAPLAPPPPSGDVSHGITSWGMDGNDEKGCCVEAATDHYDVAKSADPTRIGRLGAGSAAGAVGPVALYCRWGLDAGEAPGPDGCPDQGTDPRAWLDWCEANGIIDTWAELDDLSPASVHAAMLQFKGVLVCVDLPPDAEQQFNADQPWTLAGGASPDPNAGHAILLVRYDATGDTFVTWARLQAAAVAWDAACITGAFVLVDRNDPAVDVPAMATFIAAQRVHGAPAAPAPPPAPTPPAPPAGLSAWLEDVRAWTHSIDAWVHAHFTAESPPVPVTPTQGGTP